MGVAAVAAVAMNASAATSGVGMVVSANPSAQEQAAIAWFQSTYTDGVVLNNAADLAKSELKTVWIHVDRVGLGKGFTFLPSEFSSAEAVNGMKAYLAKGGTLYLSKHATQIMTEIDRVPGDWTPGLFGDADGGAGTDIWCVNAYLGSWQINPNNDAKDASQIYDRRSHSIYNGLEEFAQYLDFPHPCYPMEGTTDGSEIHREDHNCMWDLNAYTWSADGKNTLEQMEKQYDCKLLGTWGHVQDYCVAGIVEFNKTATCGTIIANGLAACEWAPRTNNNAYHSNLTKLTENTLDYLAAKATTSSVDLNVAEAGEAAYYTLQGVRVAEPESGLYIVVKEGRAQKVLVK